MVLLLEMLTNQSSGNRRRPVSHAETIGVSKKGQVFFVALPLLVALASFATLEPSELLSP